MPGFAPPSPDAHPVHHPSSATLVEYAGGVCDEGAALALACHLTLCPSCRTRLQAVETVGGALLDAIEETPDGDGLGGLPADALQRTLARLDEPETVPAPASPPDTRDLGEPSLLGLPRPLARYLAAARERRWRFLVPGVRSVELPLAQPGTTARLMKLKPGLSIPRHDHSGPEYTVIFTGSLDEPDVRLTRGDLLVRDAGDCHEQRVGREAPCVALVVTEGPFKPLTLRGRLLAWWLPRPPT